MNLPLFIARRIARPSEQNRPSVMVRIATIAVALSLAVMLISISVIDGFKVEVNRKIVGFAADIEVCDIRSSQRNTPYPIHPTEELRELIESTCNPLSISRFASRSAIIRGEESMEGIQLKGMGPDYDTSFLRSVLVEGALPRTTNEPRTKDLLLSRLMAERLRLGIGDKVELIVLEEEGTPRRDRFKITGLYHSGMEEVDMGLAYTDLRNVQRLNGWQKGEVTGFEVRLSDKEEREVVGDRLNRALLYSELEECYNVVANTIRERYPAMFDWLITHNINAAVILTIMLLVALFNMISVLLILVLERTRMIGLLKAFGMNNREVGKIFLYRALFIIIKGVAWGNLVALALTLAQKWGHFLKLDSAGYLLSEVPIALNPTPWIAINLGTIVVILLLLALPAGIVARIRSEQTIRYE